MVFLTSITRKLRDFIADERGLAGIEFLSTCPLLFGVMIFTSEYGQALRVRTALDGAVHDSARYLARAPAQSPDGGQTINIYPDRIAEAQQLIEQRVGRPTVEGGDDQPAFEVSVSTLDRGNFRTDYYVVEVTATILMEMPLLSFLNIQAAPGNRLHDPNFEPSFSTGLLMTATTQARYLDSSALGGSHCNFVDKAQESC